MAKVQPHSLVRDKDMGEEVMEEEVMEDKGIMDRDMG